MLGCCSFWCHRRSWRQALALVWPRAPAWTLALVVLLGLALELELSGAALVLERASGFGACTAAGASVAARADVDAGPGAGAELALQPSSWGGRWASALVWPLVLASNVSTGITAVAGARAEAAEGCRHWCRFWYWSWSWALVLLRLPVLVLDLVPAAAFARAVLLAA